MSPTARRALAEQFSAAPRPVRLPEPAPVAYAARLGLLARLPR